MRGNCPLSCGACPKPKYDGPVATARVYNAWDEEDEGGFIARCARLEARVRVRVSLL